MLVGLKLNPAQKRLLSGFIDTYLKLNLRETKEFSAEVAKAPLEERKEVMELTTSWKEEGIKEGLKKGKIEGKIEGKREMLTELISYRFGELDSAIEKRILALTDTQNNALAKALFDFKSLNDLINWLDQLN
jgi:hypothetical protein